MTHLAKRQRDQKLWQCLIRDLEKQHKGSSGEIQQERKKSGGQMPQSRQGARVLYQTYMGRNESSRDQSRKRLAPEPKPSKIPIDVRSSHSKK